MIPFASSGYHEYLVERETFQESMNKHRISHNATKMNTKKDNKDHEVVLLPVSPRHNPNNGIHLLAKSRLAWLIAVLVVVVLVLLYQAYFEHMKKLRLIGYLERVDELKVVMERLQHSIKAGNKKLEQIQHMYYYGNTTVDGLSARIA